MKFSTTARIYQKVLLSVLHPIRPAQAKPAVAFQTKLTRYAPWLDVYPHHTPRTANPGLKTERACSKVIPEDVKSALRPVLSTATPAEMPASMLDTGSPAFRQNTCVFDLRQAL
jgi:hypothetical protein